MKLKEIHHELKLSLIYVTHDQIEALTFADQVVVMTEGEVVQVGSAQQLFEAGGASMTARTHNFDRHWRNLRTIFNHNPLLHKARVVGAYHLTGETQHLKEGRIF